MTFVMNSGDMEVTTSTFPVFAIIDLNVGVIALALDTLNITYKMLRS